MDHELPLLNLQFDLRAMPPPHATHTHSQDRNDVRPRQDLPYEESIYISEAMSRMADRTDFEK